MFIPAYQCPQAPSPDIFHNTGTNNTAFLRTLERSLPNHFWDLNANHVAVLLFAAARSSSRTTPAVRSLCARLSNLYEDAERVTLDRDSSDLTRSTPFDLEILVVVAWSLDRFSRRKLDDAQLKKMVQNLSPSLFHWVDQGTANLADGSKSLLVSLPPEHYAKLCTAFVCLGNIIKRCPANVPGEHKEHDINQRFSHFVELVTKACLNDHSSYNMQQSDYENTTFEMAYEVYIGSSLNVLLSLVDHGYDATSAIASYITLIDKLDLQNFQNVDILVQTYIMLTERDYDMTTGNIGPRLLGEIGRRDLSELTNDQLYRFLCGCSDASIQHLAVLDAIGDAFLQRSHHLPDIPRTIEILEFFTKLSYHNAPVLEMFVRHVQNNMESATPAHISSMLQSCRSLQFDNPVLEAFNRDK
ncbi:phosphoribosylformylglycinamidine synthase, putative [Babesia ovis]|uniref:Phosphoribosylformylglycinamidine synthase, putative n=1 Tax=Babesia ovis TaxID=5869 RepID=A0A9W5TA00_BABOV|nr:phosphoribosylformylglycinamidine synthase, putative [Babesia ovis]